MRTNDIKTAPSYAGSSRRSCPEGTYAIRSNAGAQSYFCAPMAETSRDETTDPRPARASSCEAFNAGFNSFYEGEVGEYSGMAAHNRRVEREIETEIAQRKTLQRQLRNQSFQERNMDVKRHLASQARSVSRDIQGRQRRLRALRKDHKSGQKRWKSGFRNRARRMLGTRPAGCRVEASAGLKRYEAD